MKLVFGLGNPGERYRNTPHNVGFIIADALAERLDVRFRRRLLLGVRAADGRCDGEKLVLAKPQTYMNLSGEAVQKVKRYYKVETSDLLVVVDDADLPLGVLRMRPDGGDGGHRGLRSIIGALGGQNFARLRVGIGRDERGKDLVDHVLAPFSAGEAPLVKRVAGRAADAVLSWVTRGVADTMNEFNARTVDDPR